MSFSNNFPVINPTLKFDFRGSETLDPLITFARNSVGTRFNRNGALEVLSAGQPRFDYDPVTRQSLGLLVEEQRTNLSTNSVLASAWGSASNASHVDTQALAPDGTNTAWRLTEDSANSLHFGSMVNIATTYTSGTTYTVSRFLKASGRNVVTVYLPATNFAGAGRVATFNLTTGNVVSTETGVTATIQNVGNGWYRCSASAVANATGSGHVGGSALTDNGTASYQGDGVSGAFVWGHQLEAGAFPTSYIPTTTAAVIRNRDELPLSALSSWLNQSEGTLYAEFDALLGQDQQAFTLAASGGNGVRVRKRSVNQYGFVVRDGGVKDLALTPSVAFTEGQFIKVAGAYKVNDVALTGGGQTETTGSVYAIQNITQAYIGGDIGSGSTYINSHLRRIAYYPRRLTTGFREITA